MHVLLRSHRHRNQLGGPGHVHRHRHCGCQYLPPGGCKILCGQNWTMYYNDLVAYAQLILNGDPETYLILMKKTNNIFIQVIHKPERKVICKRGVKAEDYFPYCEEVGCDVWGVLLSMDSLCGEPVCLWLPQQYKKPNTSTYVQGVEVSADYSGPVPEGYDTILLPAADYLMFQGEPFAEEDYCDAIASVQQAMDSYDPAVIGYAWDDSNPRIQLEPRGKRGYIEMRAIKRNA